MPTEIDCEQHNCKHYELLAGAWVDPLNQTNCSLEEKFQSCTNDPKHPEFEAKP